jgi:hypothetical protein
MSSELENLLAMLKYTELNLFLDQLARNLFAELAAELLLCHPVFAGLFL